MSIALFLSQHKCLIGRLIFQEKETKAIEQVEPTPRGSKNTIYRLLFCSERRQSLFEMEALPGENVTVRELDDVLLRDVGNKIKNNPKLALFFQSLGRF